MPCDEFFLFFFHFSRNVLNFLRLICVYDLISNYFCKKMKAIFLFRCLIIKLFIIVGIFFASCSKKVVISSEQMQRLDAYVYSENEYISGMFFDENLLNSGVQPSLMQMELNFLDALADRIDPEVRRIFDQKYTAWLYCWLPVDSVPVHEDDERQLLKCNGWEFQELIGFCREQNDDIFLLLYQLAARATCPYDRLLLQPAYDLLENFPEFNKYWREVDLSLQKEKPVLAYRTCNESTIWYTRKMLETKYGFTYTSGLTNLFDTRKMLLMAK